MHCELTATAAATLAGKQYRRDRNWLVSQCPGCGGEVVVRGSSFVCVTRCAFDRGSPLDMLAAAAGGYSEALRLAGSHVPFYAEKSEELARIFGTRRSLTEFLKKAAAAPVDDSARITLRNKYARQTGIPDPGVFPRSCVYLTEGEVNTLLLLLIATGADVPAGIQNRPLVGHLYWSDHHTVSHLSFTDVTRRGEVRLVTVSPSRLAWFGINNAHPKTTAADIYPTHLDAMSVAGHYSLHMPDRFPTAIITGRNGSTPAETPFQDIRFMGHGTSWETSLPGWSHFPDFDSRVFSDSAAGNMGLEDLLITMLHRLGKDTPGMYRFIDLCGGMLLGDGIRSGLVARVADTAGEEWAGCLRAALSRRLLDRVEGTDVFACDNGYESTCEGETKTLSNFTLEMKSVTGFATHTDLVYSALLRIGSFETRVDLSAKQFENPRELEKALGAVQFDRQTDSGGSLALIHDHKEFAKVLAVLRRQVSTLPRIRGVRTLGWSRSRDSFATPVAVALPTGIQDTASFKPRDGSVHTCYRSRGSILVQDNPVRPELNPALAEVLGVMVSQMIRFHNNLTVRPLAVLNSSENRRLGLRLFRELGQDGPLWLEDILPRSLEDNRGMPCLINGLKELQGQKAPMAGLWMAEKGLDLTKFGEAEIDAAAAALPQLLLLTATRMLAGKLDSFTERRSVELLNAFAREGAGVIRSEFWPDWPEAGYRWRAIDTMLETQADKIQQLARIDTADDSLLLVHEIWREINFDSDDITIELGLWCERVTRDKDTHTIRVDKNSAYRMFNTFYGEVPRLETVKA